MNEVTDATATFASVWRLKWLVLLVGIVVAVGTYIYYKQQPAVYSSTTQVFVGGAEEQGVVSGLSLSKGAVSNKTVANQAALINSSLVGSAARATLRRAHHLAASTGKAHAAAATGSGIINITAEAHSGGAAAQLANAYATAYVGIQSSRHLRQINAAIARTQKQINKIETTQAFLTAHAVGKRGDLHTAFAWVTYQLSALGSRMGQLEFERGSPGVQQLAPAGVRSARLLGPTPRKDALFGFLVGLALAAFAAYLVGVFDPRMRSLAEVEAAFGVPLLTGLPQVDAPIAHANGQPAPAEALLEPVRRLHTTVHVRSAAYADLSHGEAPDVASREPEPAWGSLLQRPPLPGGRGASPKSILFVSADAGDGKSTLVASLALIARDAGERVAIVDADLRRPAQAALLDIPAAHGLIDVLGGRLSLEEAMPFVGPAPRSAPQRPLEWGGAEAGDSAEGSVTTMIAPPVALVTGGYLRALTSPAPAENPPALLASARMEELLKAVEDEHDFMLVDGPPPLAVSDVLPLLRLVDGLVVVVRFGHTRRTAARRLMELLHNASSAPVLGVVATAVPPSELRRHGLWSPYNGSHPRSRQPAP
jgi:Mrp family chromosome partitioning ATPase